MFRKKASLQAKAVLLVCLFLLATNLALSVVLIRQARSSMRTQLEERMLDVVKSAAALLDGDALAKLTPEEADTPEYRAVLDTLSVFMDNASPEYIYCVRVSGDRDFSFGIDPDPITPAEFNAPFVYSDALYAASKGVASVDKAPDTDQWGRFYSAFCPVFDSAGNVSGIVSADFSADWFEAQIRQNQRTVLIGCILFLAIGVALTLALTGQYSRRLDMISGKLNELDENLVSLTKDSSALAGEMLPAEAQPESIRAIGDHITEITNNLRDHITRTNTQANSMITAMASDYRSVYYVNLDENDGVCYRDGPTDLEQTVAGIHFPYLERFTWYAEHCVTEKYREGFLSFIEPDSVRESLAAEPIISYAKLI